MAVARALDPARRGEDRVFEEWGPLAGLIGDWASGYDGVDVSYHNEDGKVNQTPYRESTSFAPFGPVDNGDQCLYGLDYRTAIHRRDEDRPFHTEVGYWMWDAEERQVLRCFIMGRGQAVVAGGTAAPDATTFRLGALLGSNTYGILSNEYLDRVARTTRYDVTVTVDAERYHYDQTTVVEHKLWPTVILHTDRNTLGRVTRDA
ncbi:MAG: FABP family protein [Acidimicrobiales bacterium]